MDIASERIRQMLQSMSEQELTGLFKNHLARLAEEERRVRDRKELTWLIKVEMDRRGLYDLP